LRLIFLIAAYIHIGGFFLKGLFMKYSIIIIVFLFSLFSVSAQSIQWDIIQGNDPNITITAMNSYHKDNIVMAVIEEYPAPDDPGFSKIRYAMVIRSSNNGGMTWHKDTVSHISRVYNNFARVRGFSFYDSLTIIGVGDSGLIVRTTDGGKQWDIIQKNKYWNYTQIDCKGNYGIAVGNYGTVAITTDAGMTWNIQEKRFHYLLKYAQCVSPQYMIAHNVLDCRHYITKDFGTTWDSIQLSNNCYYNPTKFIGDEISSVFYYDEMNGLAYGRRFRDSTDDYYSAITLLGKTSDGGRSWQFNDDTTNLPIKLSAPTLIQGFKASPYIFTGSFRTEFMYSSDNGQSWKIDSTITSLIDVNKDARYISFSDPTTIYCASTMGLFRGTIQQSTDVEEGSNGNPYLFIDVKPIPAKNDITLRIYGLYSITSDFSLLLYDSMGSMVKDISRLAQKNQNGAWADASIPVQDLTPGVYVLVFKAGTDHYAKKILIAQ